MPHAHRHSDPPRGSSHRHRSSRAEDGTLSHSRKPEAGSGRGPSLICALFGGLGFAAALIATAISQARQAPPSASVNLLAGTCAAVAFAAGVRAQIGQLRHWSRRVKRRLLVGLPLALGTALAVIVSARERPPSPAGARPAAPAEAAARSAKPEDDNLVKPGWYGERLANGVLLVVTSFEEDAAESRRFNRGLIKPVAFATLSVINAGGAAPVTLASPQVTLLLKNGERVASLAVSDLLAHGARADDAACQRLAERQELPVGGMIPDIPVCLDAPFDWSLVAAAEVALGAGQVQVPGRMLTAAEKQDILFRSPAKQPAATNTVSAEAWFKNL